jgi:hypothetical protein
MEGSHDRIRYRVRRPGVGLRPGPITSTGHKVDSVEQTRRGTIHQDLAATAAGHHRRGSIKHRTKVIAAARLPSPDMVSWHHGAATP